MAKPKAKKPKKARVSRSTGEITTGKRKGKVRTPEQIMALMKAEQRKHYTKPHKTISARGCELCGGIHTKSEHKFHGYGSFRKTHPGG